MIWELACPSACKHPHTDLTARVRARTHAITRSSTSTPICRQHGFHARTHSQVPGCTLYAHVQELMNAFAMSPEAILAHASSAFDATAQKPKDKPEGGAGADWGGESSQGGDQRAVSVCTSVPVRVLRVRLHVRTGVSVRVDVS